MPSVRPTGPGRPRKVLRAFFAEQLAVPGVKAFPHMPKGSVGAKLIRPDLKAAGIPYEDRWGVVADFHALRHSFITALARGGVHPKTAQDSARHSDINLTMGRYTHTLMEGRATALETLPDLSKPSKGAQARATGTDGKSVFATCFATQVRSDATEDDQSRRSTGAETGRHEVQQALVGSTHASDPQELAKWGERGDLNPQPPEPQSGALTD